MELGINHTPHEGSSGTSSGSPESINGLKFGQKIYFEEVGILPNGGGSTVKSSSNRNSNNINGFISKKGQTPRCQVEGCKVDLSDAKAYYSRHKVCVFHSKSPMVVVSGLEQRFCQQCSRFHQLPEFDQGKRSCRRRLAGHNERRRKPSPGSLLSSRLGRLSSSFFGDSASRSGGGFLLDFSSYPSNSAKELWPDIKPSERVPGNPSTSTARYLHNIWPGNNSEDPQSKMFLQGSASGSSFSVPPGECITGVSSDSTCALSLLSNQNQTWSSNNSASSNQLGNLMNANGAPMSHCTGAHVSLPGTTNHIGPLWGFKDNEADVGYQVMPPPGHLGPTHVSHPVVGDQFHGNLLMEHVPNEGRQYMEVDHSIRSYNSSATGNVHWSLF